MPDQFQDYSYFSFPSPSGSAESAATSDDANGGVNVGFTEWAHDPGLDVLYGVDWDNIQLTDEDLELLASIPLEDLPIPESQDLAQPFLLQGFPYAQNAHAPTVILTPPWPTTRAHSDPPNPPCTPCPTQPAQLLSPSQPRQHAQLPRLAPVTPALPPTPPHSGHPYPQPNSSADPADPFVRTPWPPVPPPGERERLALPAPGDLNYSACEVIM